MSLLQISEPGAGQADKSRRSRRAAGVDLGTTNSLIATAVDGEVRTLAGSKGSHLLPSAVRYGDGGVIAVGAAAKAAAAADPANVIVSAKRALGKSLDELTAGGDFPQYRFEHAPGAKDAGAPAFLTAAGPRDPAEVAAEILRTLAERARQQSGEPIEGAVITVPAYFNDAQRQQTRHAARLAGIEVLRLLNEPTAAAVAYGLDSGEHGNIVVFDLGGGTFDVSLLSLRKGVFEVLATGGDTALGGDDFDRMVADWLVQRSGAGEVAAQDWPALLRAANRAREALSDADAAELCWNGWRGSLSAAQFADLAAPLLRRAMIACRRVLRDASLDTGEIDNVLLVGGATRMPLIRSAVADFFGREPRGDIDPDRVVAIGAGIQAEVLIGNKPAEDFLLLDVNPLSLGIETMGELVEKIIARNTAIPVAKSQEFTTFKDGQTAMSLHVVQGERELVGECRSLARFSLRGIPPMVAGAAKVKVTFQVDADGLLSVAAEETSTGSRAEVQVKPSFGLDSRQIEQMLQDSRENARADMQARALGEARLDATRLMDSIHSALREDGELLEAAERETIDQALAALAEVMKETDAGLIEERGEQLNRASEAFAARRMNLTVGAALRGESIDALSHSSQVVE